MINSHPAVRNQHSCESCPKVFKYLHSLEDHIRNQHMKQQGFECGTCSEQFVVENELLEHTETFDSYVLHFFDVYVWVTSDNVIICIIRIMSRRTKSENFFKLLRSDNVKDESLLGKNTDHNVSKKLFSSSFLFLFHLWFVGLRLVIFFGFLFDIKIK